MIRDSGLLFWDALYFVVFRHEQFSRSFWRRDMNFIFRATFRLLAL